MDSFIPQTIRDLLEYLFVLFFLVITSIAGFLERNKRKRWLWRTLFVDLICSVATGFTAYYVLMGVTGNELLAVGSAGYFGHLGAVGFEKLQDVVVENNGVLREILKRKDNE